MENVYFEGIEKISPDDIDYGKQLNFVLKPLSVGIQNKDQITLGSFPAFVKTDSLLASIQNENNAVLVNAENVGGTMYSGPGAGAKPTANSVLSDVIDIARGKIFDYGKFVEQNLFSSFDNFSCDRYLKLQVNDKPGVVAKISTLLANNNLSIDNLIQKELERSDDQIPLVIVLSNSDETTIQETIKELEALDEVSGPLTHIRILDI